MVICLERAADLHMAQLMPLPLTVFCFSKIQIGFTFLVAAHLRSPGKGPLNECVCVCYLLTYLLTYIVVAVINKETHRQTMLHEDSCSNRQRLTSAAIRPKSHQSIINIKRTCRSVRCAGTHPVCQLLDQQHQCTVQQQHQQP